MGVKVELQILEEELSLKQESDNWNDRALNKDAHHFLNIAAIIVKLAKY